MNTSRNNHIFDSLDCSILDYDILEKVLLSASSSLKNNKACSFDLKTNKMIKSSVHFLSDCYLKLFNSILKSGCFPDIWRNNIIKPLYKTGQMEATSNYRGIAISSCISKFFCKVLDRRLQKYLDNENIISGCQIWFKPGFRTNDHIFALTNIVEKYISKGNNLYACFVDLRKAFDTVWRDGLIHNIKLNGIGGNFLKVLVSMYEDVRFCVKIEGSVTESFNTNIGVKQGCALSHKLFNIYNNDIPTIFDESCDPVCLNSMKVNCLMYACYTVHL